MARATKQAPVVTLPEFKMVAVGELIAYERNARTHSSSQVRQIAASIREFGWTVPVLIGADFKIIAGHGRVEAARLLKVAAVPCLVLEHLTPAQRRAYVIADNKLAELAGWDDELLALELRDLGDLGFDVATTGFAGADVDALIAALSPPIENEDPEPEVIPDPPAVPVSRGGDLWLLDKHRVLCGDATKADDVARLLAGTVPVLMVTDPPYGVEYDPAWRVYLNENNSGQRRDSAGSRPDSYVADGTVVNDGRADWSEAWKLFPGNVAYVWHATWYTSLVQQSLEQSDFEIRAQLIWRKPHFALGRGHYHWQHEPCWYAVRKGASGNWCGDRKQSSVWDIENGMGWTTKTDGPDARTGHGTQKPIECMQRPMRNNSRRGDGIYEPFLGSGSTVIAADAIGRHCFGMEILPAYVDVVVRRWQNLTGKQAELAGTGETFAEVEAARRG